MTDGNESMPRRIWPALLAFLLLGAAVIALALHHAAALLREEIRSSLGPAAEIGEIRLGWTEIEIADLRLPAPEAWPGGDALRAARIVVVPDLAALFSRRQIRIGHLLVEQAYLSLLRTRSGQLRLLPGLIDQPPRPTSAGARRQVVVDTIEFADATIDFHDASIARPPHRIRLEGLHADIGPLRLPALDGRTRLHIGGSIKGVRRDGRLELDGWIELASRDSEIATRLRGIDLLTLQPYLLRASETGVQQGELDLGLDSRVRENHLHAPGVLTLRDLELAPGRSPAATFMGLPRAAVIGLMKDRSGRITLRFSLDGELDDPKFSLNETLALHLASALAEGLGISVETLARGVGSATQNLAGRLARLLGR